MSEYHITAECITRRLTCIDLFSERFSVGSLHLFKADRIFVASLGQNVCGGGKHTETHGEPVPGTQLSYYYWSAYPADCVV